MIIEIAGRICVSVPDDMWMYEEVNGRLQRMTDDEWFSLGD